MRIPDEKFQEIKEKILRPEGTFHIIMSVSNLFGLENVQILNIVTGKMVFLLSKEGNRIFFTHSTPSVGTRISEVDISSLNNAKVLGLTFTWSPTEIHFYVGEDGKPDTLIHGIGRKANYEIHVTDQGHLLKIGGKGIEVIGLSLDIGGQRVLSTSAIKSWNEILETIKLLKGAESDKGYFYEVAIANTIFCLLANGFEVYCKKRFCELEQEGIKPQEEELTSRFFTKPERQNKFHVMFREEATKEGISFTKALVDKRKIDFGNWDQCKRAYNKGYDIIFGNLKTDPVIFEKIQDYIQHRNFVTHVSFLDETIKMKSTKKETTVFVVKTVDQAITEFEEFIKDLHNGTLEAR